MATWLFLGLLGWGGYTFIKRIKWVSNYIKKLRNRPQPGDISEYDRHLENVLREANLLNSSGIYQGYRVQLKADGDREWQSHHRLIFYGGDRHIVTFGPTGSGKGATMQIPALLQCDGSALVIDVKGQLAAVTGQARFLNGQDVKVINPFDVLGMPTATYNPLRYLAPSSLSFAADCRKIAEGLVDVQKGDHWELSALDVVALLIQWTVLYEDEKNLVTVRRLLNLPDAKRIALFETMNGCDRADIAEGAARYMSDSKEVKDCLQTAVVQLAFLRDEGIARVLQGGGDEVSFADLKKQLMTVYLVIPPELLHTHGRFLRLLVMSALSELFKEETRPKTPVLLMLDEFAQLGPMPLIENAAAVCRDYQIRLWLILQNIPQLQALYGKKWESFLSSAGVLQFFTPNDLETAGYLSKRSGIRTEKRASTTSNSSHGGSSGTGPSSSGSTNYSSSTGTTYSEVEVPNLSVQDALDFIPSFEALIVPGASTYISASRRHYFNDPKFLHTAGFMPDPYHMTTEERQKLTQQYKAGETYLTPETATRLRAQQPSANIGLNL